MTREWDREEQGHSVQSSPNCAGSRVCSAEVSRRNMKRQILVVDDDMTTRTLLAALLRSNGYDVRVAEGGTQALDECSTKLPDLVLLDLFMPDMSGHDVAAQLQTSNSGRTPIIMLTSSDDESEIAKAHENGATDYVIKPFEAMELLDKIKRAIA